MQGGGKHNWHSPYCMQPAGHFLANRAWLENTITITKPTAFKFYYYKQFYLFYIVITNIHFQRISKFKWKLTRSLPLILKTFVLVISWIFFLGGGIKPGDFLNVANLRRLVTLLTDNKVLFSSLVTKFSIISYTVNVIFGEIEKEVCFEH